MSRNVEEGFVVYEDLFNKGVELIFLKEQYINILIYKKVLINNVEMIGINVDFIFEGVNKYLLVLVKEQIKLVFM